MLAKAKPEPASISLQVSGLTRPGLEDGAGAGAKPLSLRFEN